MSGTAGAPVVVVGVDGSAHDVPPVRHAAQEAALRGAVPRVVHAYQMPATYPGRGDVAPSPQGLGQAEEQAWRVGRRALAGVQAQVPRFEVRCGQGPAADVLLEASAGAVLLVVGTRGRGGMDRLLLGSTSSSVVRRAPLPVTVVPVPSGAKPLPVRPLPLWPRRLPARGRTATRTGSTATRPVGSWGCCPGRPGVEQGAAGAAAGGRRRQYGACAVRRSGGAAAGPDRTGHGLRGRLVRLLQQGAYEGDALHAHERAPRGGWHLVYVPVHGDEQADLCATCCAAPVGATCCASAGGASSSSDRNVNGGVSDAGRGGGVDRRTPARVMPQAVVDAGWQELSSVPDRLRNAWWSVLQCAVAAGLAWQLATTVLGHPAPLFACVAAVVCLGIRPAQRLRRVAELAVGVSIGVAVGELLVRWIGAGAWQIALVVAVALLAALVVQDSALLTNQAGLQAVFVVALPQPPGGEIARWQDALLGGATALAVAALLPADPWRQPRRLGQAMSVELAAALRDAAQAVRDSDPAAAAEALLRARDLQLALAGWDASLAAGHDISRGSLLRRDPAGRVWARHTDLSRGLDRAAGNLRVLLRRLTSALEFDEALPACLPGLLDELAAVLELLAQDLEDSRGKVAGQLRAYGSRLDPVALHATSLSGTVAVAQLRTAVVDLLVGLGLPPALARAVLPALT